MMSIGRAMRVRMAGDLTHVAPLRVEQVEHQEVGHDVDRRGGVGQAPDDAVDPRLRSER
jgi:hypothetical protein